MAVVWVALLLVACAPTGYRTLLVEFDGKPSAAPRGLVDSADFSEAVQITDQVLAKRGYSVVNATGGDTSPHGLVPYRVYQSEYKYGTAEGGTGKYAARARIYLISSGAVIRFGEWEELNDDPGARAVFSELEAALINKHGAWRVQRYVSSDINFDKQ